MAKANIRVEGTKQLRKALRGLPVEYRKRLAKIHKAAALVGVPTAKKETPIGPTGRLEKSVRALGSQREGRIAAGKAKVPYAGPIHFGWSARNIQPNQFLFEAAAAAEDEVLDVYSDQIDELIDDVWRLLGGRL